MLFTESISARNLRTALEIAIKLTEKDKKTLDNRSLNMLADWIKLQKAMEFFCPDGSLVEVKRIW